MATSEQGDDVFEDCVEEQPQASNTPLGAPKDEEPSGDHPSSPKATNNNGAEGSGSAQTPQQQIQEKFHAARAEHQNKRYVACRDRCMDLLRSRHLPTITRCLTLQLFACCSYYYGAKHALECALIIANELGRDLDPDQQLRKDVEGLLEELEQYRPKDGAPRPYIKEFEYDDH